MLAAEMITIANVEEETDDQDASQKPKKPIPNRRLRKCVYRADDAAARQEGSQNGKHEGAEDQPNVPGLQHAALFLHHHRMQEGSSGEPRENRGVLNRVPAPVTAPSQNGIGPVGAQ